MSEQKIEGVPDGWRLVAIRQVKSGEWFIGNNGYIQQWQGHLTDPSANVYGVIEKNRNITSDDVGKMVEVKIGGSWHERKLLAVLPEKFHNRYIVETAAGNDWSHLHEARIKE